MLRFSLVAQPACNKVDWMMTVDVGGLRGGGGTSGSLPEVALGFLLCLRLIVGKGLRSQLASCWSFSCWHGTGRTTVLCISHSCTLHLHSTFNSSAREVQSGACRIIASTAFLWARSEDGDAIVVCEGCPG